MKKVLFLMVSVLVLTSCNIGVGSWGSGEHIEPSDETVSETYKLAPFEEVHMNCLGIVELIQSEEKDGTVELSAPENYAELLKFESKGGSLEIDFAKKSINIDAHKIKIKVYTNDLVKIQNRKHRGQRPEGAECEGQSIRCGQHQLLCIELVGRQCVGSRIAEVCGPSETS